MSYNFVKFLYDYNEQLSLIIPIGITILYFYYRFFRRLHLYKYSIMKSKTYENKNQQFDKSKYYEHAIKRCCMIFISLFLITSIGFSSLFYLLFDVKIKTESQTYKQNDGFVFYIENQNYDIIEQLLETSLGLEINEFRVAQIIDSERFKTLNLDKINTYDIKLKQLIDSNKDYLKVIDYLDDSNIQTYMNHTYSSKIIYTHVGKSILPFENNLLKLTDLDEEIVKEDLTVEKSQTSYYYKNKLISTDNNIKLKYQKFIDYRPGTFN